MNKISSHSLILGGEKTLSKISQTPRLDSELLLADVLNVDRVQFYYKDVFPKKTTNTNLRIIIKETNGRYAYSLLNWI